MLSQQILAQEWAIYKYNGQGIFGLLLSKVFNPQSRCPKIIQRNGSPVKGFYTLLTCTTKHLEREVRLQRGKWLFWKSFKYLWWLKQCLDSRLWKGTTLPHTVRGKKLDHLAINSTTAVTGKAVYTLALAASVFQPKFDSFDCFDIQDSICGSITFSLSQRLEVDFPRLLPNINYPMHGKRASEVGMCLECQIIYVCFPT